MASAAPYSASAGGASSLRWDSAPSTESTAAASHTDTYRRPPVTADAIAAEYREAARVLREGQSPRSGDAARNIRSPEAQPAPRLIRSPDARPELRSTQSLSMYDRDLTGGLSRPSSADAAVPTTPNSRNGEAFASPAPGWRSEYKGISQPLFDNLPATPSGVTKQSDILRKYENVTWATPQRVPDGAIGRLGLESPRGLESSKLQQTLDKGRAILDRQRQQMQQAHQYTAGGTDIPAHGTTHGTSSPPSRQYDPHVSDLVDKDAEFFKRRWLSSPDVSVAIAPDAPASSLYSATGGNARGGASRGMTHVSSSASVGSSSSGVAGGSVLASQRSVDEAFDFNAVLDARVKERQMQLSLVEREYQEMLRQRDEQLKLLEMKVSGLSRAMNEREERLATLEARLRATSQARDTAEDALRTARDDIKQLPKREHYEEAMKKNAELRDMCGELQRVLTLKMAEVEEAQDQVQRQVEAMAALRQSIRTNEATQAAAEAERKDTYLRKLVGDLESRDALIREMEDRLRRAEADAVAAGEVAKQQRTIDKMRTSMKTLVDENQSLIEENTSLRQLCDSAAFRNSTPGMERLEQLLAASLSQIRALSQLCTVVSQGGTPNVNLLLGLEDAPRAEGRQNPISVAENIQREIERLRGFISDRYAEEMGKHACAVQ
eukprot:Opistho-2@95906